MTSLCLNNHRKLSISKAARPQGENQTKALMILKGVIVKQCLSMFPDFIPEGKLQDAINGDRDLHDHKDHHRLPPLQAVKEKTK